MTCSPSGLNWMLACARSLRDWSRAPLNAEVRIPVLVGGEGELGHEVGAVAVTVRLVGQVHARLLEVVRLPQRDGQELSAVLRVEQAARHAHAHLVRVAHAVCADVAVGAEQLHEVEVGHSRVEQRQVVLLAEWHVQIQQARLQREPPLRARAGVALEDQSGIEAGDGQGARRVGALAGGGAFERVLGVAKRQRRAAGTFRGRRDRAKRQAWRRSASR